VLRARLRAMLTALHESLRKLLRQQGGITAEDVNIEFEIPNRAWVGTLTKPTINFFLHDLEENASLRKTNFEQISARGSATSITKAPPRRLNLRYQVTVFSGEVRDQHELLWRVTALLMRHHELPTELLPPAITKLELPVSARVSQPEDGPRGNDLWNGLELPPRPSLLYLLTVPLDLELTLQSPLVLTRALQLQSSEDAAPGSAARSATIGGVIRDASGQPVAGVSVWREDSAAAGSITDEYGRYVLSNVPEGSLRLRVAAPGGTPIRHSVNVPSGEYDLELG
jgi:Pvc16 N-terminal domain/Carboxypeptidase regulatory-like domain